MAAYTLAIVILCLSFNRLIELSIDRWYSEIFDGNLRQILNVFYSLSRFRQYAKSADATDTRKPVTSSVNAVTSSQAGSRGQQSQYTHVRARWTTYECTFDLWLGHEETPRMFSFSSDPFLSDFFGKIGLFLSFLYHILGWTVTLTATTTTTL